MTTEALIAVAVAYVGIGAAAARAFYKDVRAHLELRGFEPVAREIVAAAWPWLLGCVVWPAMSAFARWQARQNRKT